MARQIGGRPEATILGTGDRVAAPIAAFANAETMHALDYCPLLPPNHITALVTPAPLALAEARAASGKDLILAIALAHEIASRVGQSLEGLRARKDGHVAPTWGLGFDAFGATAGAAKIMQLDDAAMADALGLAGYFAPVPSHNRFLLTPHGGGLAKYGPAGWTAQGGVTTAALASMGYQGDRTVLEGESGFWTMTGSATCDLEKVTAKLGDAWNILRVTYKAWPCCGIFQSPLGAFTRLIAEHDIAPEAIERIVIRNEGHGGLPRMFYPEIEHHVDAQSSLPYNIALAAYRVDVSAAWQKDRYLRDPAIRALMKRITVEPYPLADEMRHQELVVERRPYIERRPCSVQVFARGQSFTQTAEYAKWLAVDNAEFRATDEDLADKFRANAADALAPPQVEKAIDRIMNLERLDTAQLIEVLVP
jgi:2-methylcitrate dehydratase PrpD